MANQVGGRISVWMPLTIGESVKILRKRKGWSPKTLANKAGEAPGMVLALERDDHDVPLSTLSAVCDALGYWFHINLVEPEKTRESEVSDV